MKLYYSPNSPFARKVLVCAAECGLANRIEVVPMTVAPHVANAAYGAITPLAKVPAMECDDGSVLYDSAVICEYLDHLGGAARLFPAHGEARWSALRLHALGDGILDAALLARYEVAARPAPLRWNEWLEGQFLKIDRSLDYLERSAQLLSGDLDIGKVAVGCALGYLDLRFAERPWRTGRSAVAAWFHEINLRPSFEKTKPVG